MVRLLKIAIAVAASLFVGATFLPAQTPMNTSGQVWGTFVHQVQVGPGFSLPALVILNIDGSVSVGSGVMFGGLPGATTRVSPILGVWKRTGPKTVGATTLMFIFDANGVLTSYQRNRCSLKFSRDFKSYEGAEFMETTSCSSPLTCPDPLDPATIWTALPGMPDTGFPVSGKRVQWLRAGPLNP